jgi:hypothetical protein
VYILQDILTPQQAPAPREQFAGRGFDEMLFQLAFNLLTFAAPAILTTLAQRRSDGQAARHWMKYFVCLIPLLLAERCLVRPLLASRRSDDPHGSAWALLLSFVEISFVAWLGFAGGSDFVFERLSGVTAKYEARIDAALDTARARVESTALGGGRAMLGELSKLKMKANSKLQK